VPIATGVLPSYVRDYERDQSLAIDTGASIIFRPPNGTLFPLGAPLVRLSVAESLRTPWPGSGDGVFVEMVAHIMTKAISIVGPCRLYCGEKDWQNVAVLRRTVADLNLAGEIVACPSIREADGLVLGARNTKLTAGERRSASRIKVALDAAAAAILAGEDDPDRVTAVLCAQLSDIGQLEYAVVVDAKSLAPVDTVHGDIRILVSVAFSKTNLIDNISVTMPRTDEG
jgi:pantoate--beta-alanine ligase